MAIAITKPIAGVASTSNTNSYPMTAFTPTANSLLVVLVATTGTALTNPTMSGGGLTWVLEGQSVIGGNGYYIFTAQVGGSPASTNPTFSCTGDNATGAILTCLQFTGHEASDPVVQVKMPTAATTSTNANITFAAALGLNNGYAIAWAGTLGANVSTPPSGWTEADDINYSTPSQNMASAYRAGGTNANGPYTFTNASTSWVAMGIEIRVENALTTQTVTGKSRITKTILSTIGGKANILAAPAQRTIGGKANIVVVQPSELSNLAAWYKAELTPTTNGAPSSLQDGMVSFWKMNESSGTRYDVVGRNHLNSNANVGITTGLVDGASGSGAALFDRSSSKYLSINDNPSLRTGGRDWCAFGHYYRTNNTEYHYVIGKTSEFYLSWDPTTQALTLFIPNRTPDRIVSSLSGAVTGNEVSTWRFWCIWYDSATKTIYLQNHTTVDSIVLDAHISVGTGQFLIGGDSVSNYLTGGIDEVGWMLRQPTSTERTALQTGLTYPFKQLAAAWIDNSGNSRHANVPSGYQYPFILDKWINERPTLSGTLGVQPVLLQTASAFPQHAQLTIYIVASQSYLEALLSSTYAAFLMTGNTISAGIGFLFERNHSISNSNSLQFSGSTGADSRGDISDDVFYTFRLTVDAGYTSRIFINGVAAGATAGTAASAGTILSIFQNVIFGSGVGVKQIAEVAIWLRDLSSSEKTAMDSYYNQKFGLINNYGMALGGTYRANGKTWFRGTEDGRVLASQFFSFNNPSAALSIDFAATVWGKTIIGNRFNGFTNITISSSTQISIATDGSSSNTNFTVPAMTLGQEYNLIIKRESGGMARLYLNGVESSSGQLSIGTDNLTITHLGNYYTGTNAFEGSLRRFRVFNSGITGTDISNMAAGLEPVTLPDLYWRMNEVYGVLVKDTRNANIVTSCNIGGKALISAPIYVTITGKSRVQTTILSTITGKSRITGFTTRTVIGKARITALTTRTTTGKSRITSFALQTITGKSKITGFANQTITGKSNIIGVTNRTIGGKGTIIRASGVLVKRFYLSSNQIDNIGTVGDNQWTHTTGYDTYKMTTYRDGSPMTNKSTGVGITNGQTVMNRKYVSPPLAAQVISGNPSNFIQLTGRIRSQLNISTNVVNCIMQCGILKRNGTYISYGGWYSGSNADTTLKGLSFGGDWYASPPTADLVVEEGDRLVVMLGFQPNDSNGNPTGIIGTQSFGEDATTDLSSIVGDTDPDNPWLDVDFPYFGAGGTPGIRVLGSEATIDGKANIRATTVRTIGGKARIAVDVNRTITGKASIVIPIANQLITGKSRIRKTVSQTITGKGQIRSTVSSTITGKSRIKSTITSTITGKARIRSTISSTITGKARITTSVSSTITGKSRINVTVIRTITGKSRVQKVIFGTITGKANVRGTLQQNITGKARLIDIAENEITGIARIQRTETFTITGKSRITGIVDNNITGKGYIQGISIQFINGKAKIVKTGPRAFAFIIGV